MLIIVLIILFFSILSPFSLASTIGCTLLSGLILGLSMKMDKQQKGLVVIFGLFYCLVMFNINWKFGISVGISLIISFLIGQFLLFRKIIFSKLFFLATAIVLCIFVWIDGKELISMFKYEPQISDQRDYMAYLKTVYLMDQGFDYYYAFSKGIDLSFPKQLPNELWGWKQPLLFHFWNLFPGNGSKIIYLAIIVSLLNLVAVYEIARKYLSPSLALLCPLILIPYLHHFLTDQTVIQVEWWALSALIWGTTAFYYHKFWLAGILFGISLSIRELFIIPILFFLLANFGSVNFRQVLKTVLMLCLVFFPQYLIHLTNVNKYENVFLLLQKAFRPGAASGWNLVQTTLSFGSANYLFFSLRPFLVFLIITSVSLVFLIYKSNHKAQYLALLSTYLPFYILMFKMGMIDRWHDYWGIYYVPLLLAVTPIALIKASQILFQKFKYLIPRKLLFLFEKE